MDSQLDSFVQHFKQLWQSGRSAHLDIDTCAGQAWVGLRVRLGQGDGPLHQAQHQVKVPRRSRNGPSRERRRCRRLAERQKNAEEASSLEPKETETNEKVDEAETAFSKQDETLENEGRDFAAENAVDKEDSEAKENPLETAGGTNESTLLEVQDVTHHKEPANEHVVVREVPPTVAIEEGTKIKDQASEEHSDKAMKDPSDAGENKMEGDPKDPIEENVDCNFADSIEVVDELCSDAAYNVRQPQIPIKVEVSATAVFENSQNERLSREEIKSLEAVLLSKNHLKENILKLEEGQETNRRNKQGLFKHTLELRILVNTEKLWESARTYIWRNLGQNEWRKPNGAKLSLVRIHVKN